MNKMKLTALFLAFVMLFGSLTIQAKNDEEVKVQFFESEQEFNGEKTENKNANKDKVIIIKKSKDADVNESIKKLSTSIGYEVENTESILYYGEIVCDDVKNLVIIESDDDVNEINQKDLENVLIEIVEKQKNKNLLDLNNETLINEVNSSAVTPPTNYALVGSAIHLNVSASGTIIYYKEYRWYSGGSNGTTKFYYLRKDYESIDTEHKINLEEYDSTFSKYNNSYSVDFSDPTPEDDANTSSYSISYPWGISYSFSNGTNFTLDMAYSLSNDTVHWEAKRPWNSVSMNGFNFKQGVFIESSTSNTTTKVKDYTVTTVKRGRYEWYDYVLYNYDFTNTTYTYVNGSSVGYN